MDGLASVGLLSCCDQPVVGKGDSFFSENFVPESSLVEPKYPSNTDIYPYLTQLPCPAKNNSRKPFR